MPPERLRPKPEERALRGLTRMAYGSRGGRDESSSPVRPDVGAMAAAASAAVALAGSGTRTLHWNSHPDELVDGCLSVPYYFTFDGTIANIRATSGRLGSADADFDVQLNGTSIVASPVILTSAGSGISDDFVPTTPSFVRNDLLQIVGGTMNGILDVIFYFDLAAV